MAGYDRVGAWCIINNKLNLNETLSSYTTLFNNHLERKIISKIMSEWWSESMSESMSEWWSESMSESMSEWWTESMSEWWSEWWSESMSEWWSEL